MLCAAFMFSKDHKTNTNESEHTTCLWHLSVIYSDISVDLYGIKQHDNWHYKNDNPTQLWGFLTFGSLGSVRQGATPISSQPGMDGRMGF